MSLKSMVWLSLFSWVFLILSVQAQDPQIHKGDDVGKVLSNAEDLDLGDPQNVSPELMQKLDQVYTDPGELPKMQIEVDGKKYDLPLKHTHVEARIVGSVARVELKQTYKNPFTYPIETVYVFPLPENSAVDDMKIIIGDRVIEAEIKKRETARQIYEQAKKEGHTAALLEQERPNIFTQSVANIAPGEDIDVVIRYVQNLTYDSGEYEFVFPMVVGPRFIPGHQKDSKQGTGWAKDTDLVPDASRITPPVIGGGMRSGHDISLHLIAEPGLPIQSWEVITHDSAGELKEDHKVLDLSLAELDSIPNRDFILRYKVAQKDIQSSVLTYKKGDMGYFTLIVQPPEGDIDDLVGKREMIFVVDVSGSMYGQPLALCKDAMRQSLRQLRPVDTFNVLTFASGQRLLFPKPRPANQTNIREALEFVDGLKAGGGTLMNDAVKVALSPAVERDRHRYVFFMTDGYVGNEKQILKTTADFIKASASKGEEARVFGFGVGSSPNRFLIEGLGQEGHGASVYASTREDPTRAVNTFFGLIDHPILQHVKLNWNEAKVQEVYPIHMPDLFASRPLIIHGQYREGGHFRWTLNAEAEGQKISMEIPVTLPKEEHGDSTLATLWARAKVDDLQRNIWMGVDLASSIEAITQLGLDYRIVTAYTSFVAVDRSRKVGDGKPVQIVQPVDAPEGVNPAMAGAPAYKASEALGISGARPQPLKKSRRKIGHRMSKPRFNASGGGQYESKDRAQVREDAPKNYGERKNLKIRVLSVSVQGDAQLPPIVRRIFARHQSTLLSCFKNLSESVQIQMEIKIDAQGKVLSVKIKDNDKVRAYRSCLEKKVKTFRFSKGSGVRVIKLRLKVETAS